VEGAGSRRTFRRCPLWHVSLLLLNLNNVDWLIDWLLIDWLFDWLNISGVHISILSNVRDTCSGLFSEGVTSRDETGQCFHWRIILVFPFENFSAWWFLCVSTILWLTQRDLYSACLMFWLCTYRQPVLP
jgi:hypothetical protein